MIERLKELSPLVQETGELAKVIARIAVNLILFLFGLLTLISIPILEHYWSIKWHDSFLMACLGFSCGILGYLNLNEKS